MLNEIKQTPEGKCNIKLFAPSVYKQIGEGIAQNRITVFCAVAEYLKEEVE